MDTLVQEITVRLYPEFDDPKDWRVQAYVFGEWAVHEVSPMDDSASSLGLSWQISHIPSGAIAYIGKDETALIEAARRIADLTLPGMSVYFDSDGEPHLPPLQPTFARVANERVVDLDIFAVCGGNLYSPAKVWPQYKRVLKRRAKAQ